MRATTVFARPLSLVIRLGLTKLDVDRLEHDTLRFVLGRICAQLGLDVGALGERAARGVREVLAEVPA